MKNKRLKDATIEDLLQVLKDAADKPAKEEIPTDLINRAEAIRILEVRPSTVTYYINNDILKKYGSTKSGEFSKAQCIAIRKARLEKEAA